MERYFFSGGTTDAIIDCLTKMPGFEPFDVLVSQLDRSSIKKMFEYQDKGIVRSLFIDSGAFSYHTGKAKVDLEDYINFLNENDDRIFVCAQLDTIPGKFGQPKSKKDYEESARKSWENYLYMRSKMKSPDKLMPVFHYGESFDALKNMLDWRDENGNPLTYVGISPANDSSQKTKNSYLGSVADFIAASSNPNVRTHLYGMTAFDALEVYPCYSADSVSHRLITGYAKIAHPTLGIISVSKRTRTSKVKSNRSYVDLADERGMKELTDYLDKLGVTLEEVQESNAVRCAVTMMTFMIWAKTKAYKPEKRAKPKKLF